MMIQFGKRLRIDDQHTSIVNLGGARLKISNCNPTFHLIGPTIFFEEMHIVKTPSSFTYG
jgi:hypothetical protein